MGDTTIWVSAVTATTAVVASWVTSRGITNAARVQAEATAATNETSRRNEARRAAYLALVEQSHRMGSEYRKVPEALALTDTATRRTALLDLQRLMREVYVDFGHSHQLATLDAREHTAEAAERLWWASRTVYMTVGEIADGSRTPETFHNTIGAYWTALSEFVGAVRQEQT